MLHAIYPIISISVILNANNVLTPNIMTPLKNNASSVHKQSHSSMVNHAKHAQLTNTTTEQLISVNNVQEAETTSLKRNNANAQKLCSGMILTAYPAIFPNILIFQRRNVWAVLKIKFMTCKWKNVLIVPHINLSLMEKNVLLASCQLTGMQLQEIVWSAKMVKLMIHNNWSVFAP